MDLHIGHEIEKKYQESGIKLSEFAKRLNTGTRNVYSIFERKDISSGLLKKICEVLEYNFFELYEKNLTGLVAEPPLHYSAKEKKLHIVIELDGTPQTLNKWVDKLSAINKLV